jgi:hypothetical protein
VRVLTSDLLEKVRRARVERMDREKLGNWKAGGEL